MEPLNTIPIQQFIQKVKTAEMNKSKEVRVDITTAKNLAFTLGIVMSRLESSFEELIATLPTNASTDVTEIKIDGGSNWK